MRTGTGASSARRPASGSAGMSASSRVIPRNPAYAHVEATLDTGASARGAAAPLSAAAIAAVRTASTIYDRMSGRALADVLTATTDAALSLSGRLESDSTFLGSHAGATAAVAATPASGPRIVTVRAE